jgi:hypothetical protein
LRVSPNPNEEEPVAYLGGKAGESDAPVEGYLGGAAAPTQPEELPALPPAGVSSVLSASDFIAPPPEVEEPPPAYDSYAADPVAEPAPEQSEMDQYAHPAETDPAPGTKTVIEPSTHEGSSDFDEPGLPKTISQQDAENIIKRITTKKILPPDVAANEGPRVNPPTELTPRGSPKLGRLVVLLLIVIGGYGAAVYFNDQLAPYLPPEFYWLIQYTPPPPPPSENAVKEDPPEVKKKKSLEKVILESEFRAFGFNSEADMNTANKEIKAAEKKSTDGNTSSPSDGSTGGH